MQNNTEKNDTLQNDKTTPAEAVAAIKAVPTSAKLVELQNAYKAAFLSHAGLTDITEMQTAMLGTYKLQNEIATELAAIKAADKAAENEMAKNARILLVTNLLVAHSAKIAVDADKKSTDDQRNVANDAFNAAKDIVTNELLARYATSKPANMSAGTDKPAGERGATGAQIIALHTANIDKGITSADSKAAIIASGFSRGTTGAVVLAWEKEQGLK